MSTALTAPSPFVEVEAALREHPGRFNFFQAVRLLLRMQVGQAVSPAKPQRKLIGDFADPRREALRFQTHNSLSFPPTDIFSLDFQGEQPRMSVNFMGLTGPAGVLPYCYSELVSHRIREKDHTAAAFFDIFNHRAISLFYRAWEKYRAQFAYERDGEDRLSSYLYCLIGMGTPGLRERMTVNDQALLFYTGSLSLQPRSATSLKYVIEDYFDVPCAIEEFVGSWQWLDVADQCVFADGDTLSEQMGMGAVVGDAIWDLQSRVRLRLGPLTLAQYASFLPQGAAYQPLRELTRFFCGTSLEVEVQLVLRQEEVPRCGLGHPGEERSFLGWTTWMKSGLAFDRSPEDTILLLS